MREGRTVIEAKHGRRSTIGEKEGPILEKNKGGEIVLGN